MSVEITVVLPAYNEEKRFSAHNNTVAQVDSYLRQHFNDYEILIVNDGSTDGTLRFLGELEKKYAALKVLSYDKNRGKGYAVRRGMLAAAGPVIVFTDCDLAYGCDVFSRMTAKLREDGADIVIGSRRLAADGYEGYTFLRKLASRTYFSLLSTMAGFKYSDSQSGIKCFKREAAHGIFELCQVDGFAFDFEALMIADKLGYKVSELGVKVLHNENADSKVRLVKDAVTMTRDIIKTRKRLR
jgi:dolichyl-phosphate beta-glucosyltransferase